MDQISNVVQCYPLQIQTDLCHICLVNGNELTSLSDRNPNDPSSSLTYLEKLDACIPSINITKRDPTLQLICRHCSELLETSYEFYVLCVRSDGKLRQQSASEIDVKVETKEEPEYQDTTTVYGVEEKLDIGSVKILDEYHPPTNPNTKCKKRKQRINGKNDGLITKTNVRKRKNAAPSIDENGKLIRRKRAANFKCDICGKMKTGKFLLEQHIRTHTGERPFTCEICGKSFKTRGNIKNHLESHNVDRIKRYKCSTCSYQTPHLDHIKRHEMIHKNERLYECRVCSRRFNSEGNMYLHVRNMHTEPSIPCEFCTEKFRTKGGLRRHIIRHYRAAHYKCSECKKIYSTHNALVYHMKRHHVGVKWPTEKASYVLNTSIVLK